MLYFCPLCATTRQRVRRTTILLLALFIFPVAAFTQNAVPTTSPEANQSSGQALDAVTVLGQLNEAREQIVPYLGATKYSIGQTQIQNQSQGDIAHFNQLILRGPRVAQDSFCQLHVRNEHANLQFRIDESLIP